MSGVIKSAYGPGYQASARLAGSHGGRMVSLYTAGTPSSGVQGRADYWPLTPAEARLLAEQLLAAAREGEASS